MIVPISHLEWQALRTVVRAKTPPTGAGLRAACFTAGSRKHKDGKWLRLLVKRGLLAVVDKGKDPMTATFKLTPEGKHAAEFGQYDADPDTAALKAVKL